MVYRCLMVPLDKDSAFSLGQTHGFANCSPAEAYYNIQHSQMGRNYIYACICTHSIGIGGCLKIYLYLSAPSGLRIVYPSSSFYSSWSINIFHLLHGHELGHCDHTLAAGNMDVADGGAAARCALEMGMNFLGWCVGPCNR